MPIDRRRASLGIVAMTMFLDLLGFGIIIPLMPHFARTFGATPLAYGLLAASYSLMQFLFVPVWGRLSDRVGRRPVLLISIGGSVVSFVLLGAARSLAMLFAARILSGISASNLSVAQAYVADVTAPEERARGMGLIGAAFGLGFVVGPFVGGELSQLEFALPLGVHLHAGSAPFLVSALLSAINWGLAWALLPESLPPAARSAATIRFLDLKRLEGVFAHREISGLFAVSFLFTMAFSMMEQSLILFGEDRLGMRGLDAGKLLGFVGVLIVLVQGGLVGRLARRFGEGRLTVVGAALMVPGLLLIPLAPGSRGAGYAVLYTAMVPLALGNGLLHPSLHSLLSRRAPGDEQGGVLGLNQSLSSLARVAGPTAGGLLFQTLGIGTPFLAGGAVMLAAATVAVSAVRPPAVPADRSA
jgi:MFS transporter, DHA1 family, tetracycline resistance protein